MTVIDCPNIAGPKAPVAPVLNTPLQCLFTHLQFVPTQHFFNLCELDQSLFHGETVAIEWRLLIKDVFVPLFGKIRRKKLKHISQ